MTKNIQKFWLFLVFITFIGCSYAPISKITKEILGEKVYAQTEISIKDPKNSVLISDALKAAIISRFHAKLTKKKDADTIIYANIHSVEFSPTIYDRLGYVTAYKAFVRIKFKTIYKNGEQSEFICDGDYNFKIESNSVISDTKRFEAIKFASQDALDEYIARTAMRGLQNGNNDK